MRRSSTVFVAACLLAVALVGCDRNPANTRLYQRATDLKKQKIALERENTELRTTNEDLAATSAAKDEQILASNRLINMILDDLSAIAEREGLVRGVMVNIESRLGSEYPASTEAVESVEKQFTSYLSVINTHLQESRERVERLKSLEAQVARIPQQQSLIRKLEQMVQDRETTVRELRDEVATLMVQVKDLEEQNTQLAQQNRVLAEENEQLARSYYIVASKDELIAKDIVEKSFLSPTRLDRINPRHFQVADVGTDVIPLPRGKEAKIFSNHKHAPGLYTISDGRLVIRDPETFWNISKYLIVEVK